jgi:ribonuclease BN (tRNA processing enzyme)
VIYTMPLHHPDRATAYRIVYQGKSVAYVTDVEHKDDELDKFLISFIRNSDVFIYDSTYDDRQFEEYIGWGHSTWQHAMRLGEAASVGKVVMFHHDPGATDDVLNDRAEEVQLNYTQPAVIAKEGMIITL